MANLFDKTTINGLQLKNRFVRSATWEGMAEPDGTATEALINLMAEIAEGGVGLIITGHAYVEKRGQATPYQLGVYDDQLKPGIKQIAAAVHDRGGKIVMQLAHAGLFADTTLTNQPAVAPSAVTEYTETSPNEMTVQDIDQTVDAFGQAARRAVDAGFDGVQIHAAHGYLLSQFLSPAFNRRSDAYGGPIENRVRIVTEVLARVREHVGSDYPVLVKMNTSDYLDGGLEVSDAVAAARILEEKGIDAIEMSGGTGPSGKLGPVRIGISSEDREAYFRTSAVAFKKAVDVPLLMVGGIRSYQIAHDIIDVGLADYISMSRPFIREPDLVNRWQSGDHSKATCRSDNKCFVAARSGKGIYCVVEKRLQEKNGS